MPRIQMTISSKVDEMLRKEALRRIKDNDDAGRRPGSVIRDLILVCISLSFDEARKLSSAEIEAFLRRLN